MKDKIVELISKIKSIFAKRRSNMPTARFHKEHIDALAADESVLEDATKTFEKLEVNRQFAATALFYLMEKVVPVFRNWMNRINSIIKAHQTDLRGHILAKKEYDEHVKEVQALLAQMNVLDGAPLIKIDPTEENQGRAIVKQYQREKYLSEHPIQIAENDKMDEELACVMATSLSI